MLLCWIISMVCQAFLSHKIIATLAVFMAQHTSLVVSHSKNTTSDAFPDENKPLCKEGRHLIRSVCWSQNYDVADTPLSEDTVTSVNTNLLIKGIREINEKKRLMAADVRIVFSWLDERIFQEKQNETGSTDDIQLGRHHINEIWKPEIYI